MTKNKHCYVCDELVAGQGLLEHAKEDKCKRAFTRLIESGIITPEQARKIYFAVDITGA